MQFMSGVAFRVNAHESSQQVQQASADHSSTPPSFTGVPETASDVDCRAEDYRSPASESGAEA